MVDLQQYRDGAVHFIGIGGCSMSGLAVILKDLGYIPQGSDINESVFTRKLEEEGIPFSIGHKAKNLGDARLVVYSAAIKPGNPEYDEAVRRGVPMLTRAELLGQISRQYDTVIGIAGCHGKTTITSMTALVLRECGVDLTVHVGGMVDFLGGGVAVGSYPAFLTEACEYVGSFLELRPTYELVNNIDDDHLDYYKNIEEIYGTFLKFAHLMPESGVLFYNVHDALTVRLAEECGRRTISYGFEDADYVAENARFDENGCPEFDVVSPKGSAHVKLSVVGRHNMSNALASIVVAHEVFGVDMQCAADALAHYHLAGRRFELMGEKNGVKVIHDYAHHPAEIEACLEAASKYPHKKLWVVFQCNSYTRAKTLKDKYALCFGNADMVLVPDIFPGRDIDRGEIHARDLVQAIGAHSPCEYIPTFEEINVYLEQHASPGDVVVTLGSGSVNVETAKLLK